MNPSYILKYFHISKTQHGFTFVELMVAMAVGLFISAGIISLFVKTKQIYRTNEGMARVQENGRFAIDYLSRYVRQAGFPQIVGITPTRPSVPIQGWDGGNSAPSAANLPTTLDYAPNTDVFNITYYDTDIATPAFVTRTYYIATENGIPGLIQRLDSDPPEMIVEGVYDMQVLYGLDDNDNGQLDSYVDAVDADWNQVVAVRINLLLGSSENNLVDAPMSTPFLTNDGTTTFTADPADDRRIYQVFSTTIALRNRLK